MPIVADSYQQGQILKTVVDGREVESPCFKNAQHIQASGLYTYITSRRIQNLLLDTHVQGLLVARLSSGKLKQRLASTARPLVAPDARSKIASTTFQVTARLEIGF